MRRVGQAIEATRAILAVSRMELSPFARLSRPVLRSIPPPPVLARPRQFRGSVRDRGDARAVPSPRIVDIIGNG